MAECTEAPQPPGPGSEDPVSSQPSTAEAVPPQVPVPKVPKGNAGASPGRPSNHAPKYALPLPIRTFPLPTFYPSNPLSLAHLALVWLGQFFFPPPTEPSVIYTGNWSPTTRSVHVTDPRAMHDLWCQGFFGKGSLSRSEPSWLNREKARRGLVYETSEQRTTKRREERADTKWERGRTEFEAIEQRRLREAEAERQAIAAEAAAAASTAATFAAASTTINGVADKLGSAVQTDEQFDVPVAQYAIKPPVGPLELLALPNSQVELLRILAAQKMTNGKPVVLLDRGVNLPTTATSLASPAILDENESAQTASSSPRHNGSAHRNASMAAPREIDSSKDQASDSMGLPAGDDTTGSSNAVTPLVSDNEGANESLGDGSCTTPPCLKQQKSVRFSPTIESTTFQHSDPPSRNHTGAAVSPSRGAREGNGAARRSNEAVSADNTTIQNKEHLQLSAEEAFFLVYALGTLVVRDPAADNAVLSTEQLFRLFRQHSYFPPRTASDQQLAPDDPFLVHYAVYHHFRSLGWVPRHGIKFGVDWLLYGKGPALDHAPFGVVVVPSYSDPWWRQAQQQQQQRQPPRKSWHWLHSVNRVLTTVYKSMVIVYVDIPAPIGADADGATALLQRYKIREVMVRRWSSNRNRD